MVLSASMATTLSFRAVGSAVTGKLAMAVS